MQLEAIVKQNDKVIIHTFLEAETLQRGLTQIETYVRGEKLSDLGECNIRIRMLSHHDIENATVDVTGFGKFTYDALKNS